MRKALLALAVMSSPFVATTTPALALQPGALSPPGAVDATMGATTAVHYRRECCYDTYYRQREYADYPPSFYARRYYEPRYYGAPSLYRAPPPLPPAYYVPPSVDYGYRRYRQEDYDGW